MKTAELSELSGRTLLVVEDDDDVVDMLATLLGRYGVHLVRTRTIADARAVADAVAYVETAPRRVGPAPSRHLYMTTTDGSLRRWGLHSKVVDDRAKRAKFGTAR